MKTKHLILLCFLIFTSLPGLSKAFNCYNSSNLGEVGPAGSACEGMLIVNRWRLLNATFSGSDAYTTKDGTNYYFGGANGGVFTGQVTNFNNIFLNKVNFNADIGYWDTSRATSFSQLFANARSFNQDIGSWDVSNVTNFNKLFFQARAFNQDLNNWDTSRVTNMTRVFAGARAFNGDISSWNVSRVRTMKRAFDGASSFNQDIGGWDVSNVTRMVRMFKNAIVIDQDLTQWNVTKIRKEPKVFANRLPRSKYPCWGMSSCPANPLSLSSSSPADDAFDVSTSTTLTLNFSGTVYTTNQGGNILLYKSDGTLVETFNVKDSGSVTISDAQVSLDLSLEDNTDYYIQIGSGALSSVNTNSSSYYYPGILNNTTLNFSTRSSDTTAPTLTSASPQDGETDTQYENTVLRLGFSEDIVIGTGNINLYNADGLVKAYDVSDTNYVSLNGTSSLEVPLVDNNGDSVLSSDTAYYFLMDSGIVKDASDNLFAGITSPLTLNFNTSTSYCGCISGTTRRKNGNVLAGVTVKLLNSSGAVVQSVVSDANGFYHFLPDAAGTYTVEFAELNGRAVVGQASYEGMSSSGTNIKNIEITASCEDITDIDGLLVDPKGVIYDSESRSPIANVTVELLLNGSVIDDSFLDSSGGTASQVTGANGEYNFILKADTATSGTYEIRVTPPTGYRFESTKIPAGALYTPSIGTGLESIQDQTTAPASGDDTTYHLKFAFTFSTTAGQSSQGVINNHIPIDPDPTTKTDVKAMVESWTNIAIKWPEDNVQSITDRLNWLERNQNRNKQSFQGIQIRHHNEKIDQLLNLQPKSKESILTGQIRQLSSDQNSAVDIAKEVAMNELVSFRSDSLGSINYKFKPIYKDWSMWTAGEIHLGQVNSTSTSSEKDSKDLHITLGFDKKDTENNIMGWSLALGKYKTDIGTQGTNVESNNVSLSGYGSIKLNEELIIEPIVGYSHLNFDTSRKDQLQTLTGSRIADQIFTSITLKNISKSEENRRINITPYGNIYAALTEFDQYSESGGSNAITFNDQRLEHTKVSLGLEIDYLYSDSDYSIAPYFNFEVSSDLSNSSEAVMRYNNSSTEYTLPFENLFDESLTMGFGFDVLSNDIWKGVFHFSREQSSKSNYRDSLNLNFNYSF